MAFIEQLHAIQKSHFKLVQITKYKNTRPIVLEYIYIVQVFPFLFPSYKIQDQALFNTVHHLINTEGFPIFQ